MCVCDVRVVGVCVCEREEEGGVEGEREEGEPVLPVEAESSDVSNC